MTTTEELRPGARLVLDAEDSAGWRIETGTLDLYAELRLDDGATRREHLFALAEGALLLAFPPSEDLRFVASGRGGARLQRLSGEALDSLLEESSQALDHWLGRLARVIERGAPPLDFVDRVARVGESFRLRNGERVQGDGGVAWARCRGGSAGILDRRTVTVTHGALLPLAGRLWITAAGPLEISVHATRELRESGELLAAARRFQDLGHGLLRDALVEAVRREEERLAEKETFLEQDRGLVLERFAAVVDPDAAEIDASLSPLLAVLRKIGGTLGVRVPIERRRELAGRSVDAQIEDVSRRARLRSRRVVLRDRWWRRETGPMLAFLRDEDTPVALLPDGDGHQRLWMPGDRRERWRDEGRPINETLAAQVDPLAYSFYRTLPDRRLRAADLARFALGICRREIFFAILFSLLVTAMAMLVPVVMAVIIDVSIPTQERTQLLLLGAGLAGAAVAAYCFRVCQDIALLRAEGKVLGALQPALLDRLLRMPNTFFRRYSAGDLAERVKAIDDVQMRLTGGVLSTLIAGAFSLANFAILFFLEPRAALLTLAALALLLTVLWAVLREQIADWKINKRIFGRVSNMVLELVSGIRRVRLGGAEGRMFVRWGELAITFRETILRCYHREVYFNAFARGYQIVTLALVFGAVAWLADDLSTGRFLAFLAAFTLVLTGFVEIASSMVSLADLGPAYERVAPILQAVPEGMEEKSHPGKLSGRIEVHDLHFRYGEGRPWVLDGISLEIEPGQYTAIVGPSGCGKSTLFRLILGFEQPQAGGIYFDGKDLAGLDLREVRHQIGVVLQHDKLMEASIYDNIRGVDELDLEDAWQAARMAGIAEEIAAMPLGMRTVISAEGADLAGGQVQRLLIARALAARPRILLLDEATSALDNKAQAVVMESLERLRMTRVAIAHRLSTVKRADRILVLGDGKIVDDGTYEELIAKDGFFADLVRRQLR